VFALKDDIVSRAVGCATEVCWRQWRSLTAAGLPIGEHPIASIIDPEALVLLSLAVRRHERRLDDHLLWWAAAGTSLMSVQRMRTLLADFPKLLHGEVAAFAATARDAGDRRWKVLADHEKATPSGRPGKGPRELQLLEPSTLMLRLRAGFGVGAKADLLTFLIGIASTVGERTAWTTAEVIAKAISYSVASTRRAAREMTLARLVEASADRPAEFSVDAAAWARLLHLRDPFKPRNREDAGPDGGIDVPPWRFWAQMSSFLAACVGIGEDARLVKAPSVVQASHLRDLAERFRRPLAWNGIEWIDPRMFPGERYIDAFKQTLDGVVTWIGAKA
jgi:hypothetical protein